MITNEEMQKSLLILKSVCDEHNCSNCPFSMNGVNCLIQSQPPCEYKINPSTQPTWCAFTDKDNKEDEAEGWGDTY